jgi:uncharacterized protein (DUF2384 family)
MRDGFTVFGVPFCKEDIDLIAVLLDATQHWFASPQDAPATYRGFTADDVTRTKARIDSLSREAFTQSMMPFADWLRKELKHE